MLVSKEAFIVKTIPALFIAALLTGCNQNGTRLKDGDKHIPAEMNEVISNFIVQSYKSSYPKTDKRFEVHKKIYGTAESNETLHGS